MAKVTIEFHGVCVHVRRAPPAGAELPEGVDHRVVIIDGRQGGHANGHDIAPHVGRVDIYRQPPSANTPRAAGWLLDKHHLRIDGAANGQPEVQDVDCFRRVVPRLQDFTSTPLSLDSGVVVDGNQAVGLFDLSGGTIRAELRHKCAGVAIYESQVSAHATLQTQQIGGKLVDLQSLAEDIWIIVSNVGSGTDDDNADFLLNYLVSGTIPGDAGFPTECRECKGVPPSMTWPYHSIGPGCSNTQYP